MDASFAAKDTASQTDEQRVTKWSKHSWAREGKVAELAKLGCTQNSKITGYCKRRRAGEKMAEEQWGDKGKKLTSGRSRSTNGVRTKGQEH